MEPLVRRLADLKAMVEPEAAAPESQRRPAAKTEHDWERSQWAPMGPAPSMSALDVFCQDTAGKTQARGVDLECRAPPAPSDAAEVALTPRTCPLPRPLEGGSMSPFAVPKNAEDFINQQGGGLEDLNRYRAFLHQQGLVHKDLKLENVVVDGTSPAPGPRVASHGSLV